MLTNQESKRKLLQDSQGTLLVDSFGTSHSQTNKRVTLAYKSLWEPTLACCIPLDPRSPYNGVHTIAEYQTKKLASWEACKPGLPMLWSDPNEPSGTTTMYHMLVLGQIEAARNISHRSSPKLNSSSFFSSFEAELFSSNAEGPVLGIPRRRRQQRT